MINVHTIIKFLSVCKIMTNMRNQLIHLQIKFLIMSDNVNMNICETVIQTRRCRWFSVNLAGKLHIYALCLISQHLR